MLVKVKTIDQLKQEFILSLRNNCGDKVTKVTPLSVLNGFSYGLSKIVQKLNKDAAMVEAKLFPESANETILDDIASREGVPGRRTASPSSAVILFKATAGTIYPSGTQARSIDGFVFQTLESITIGVTKYGLVLSECTTNGLETNVSPFSINELVSAPPVGHISVTNPFRAIGGRDLENDYDFRNRLLQAENIISTKTEAYYEALVYKQFPNILRVHSRGLRSFDDTFELIVVKNSLADYTQGDRDAIEAAIMNSIPLSDYGTEKITVSNVTWTYIDINATIRLQEGYTLENVALDMQSELATFLNLSKWEFGKKVEWDDLLEVCKQTIGVREIYDDTFLPSSDVAVAEHSLPRFRNFQLKDIMTNNTVGQNITPAFWSGTAVHNYFVQILNQITVVD